MCLKSAVSFLPWNQLLLHLAESELDRSCHKLPVGWEFPKQLRFEV